MKTISEKAMMHETWCQYYDNVMLHTFKRDELTRRSQVSFIVCHDIEYYNVFLFLFSVFCREKKRSHSISSCKAQFYHVWLIRARNRSYQNVRVCVCDVEHFVNMECHTSLIGKKRQDIDKVEYYESSYRENT